LRQRFERIGCRSLTIRRVEISVVDGNRFMADRAVGNILIASTILQLERVVLKTA
jgi:hypothetical protein